MFYNFSSLCITKILKRNKAYGLLIKNENKRIANGYTFSRCRDHATKLGEAFLKRGISEGANERIPTLWYINKKRESQNQLLNNNSSEIANDVLYGEPLSVGAQYREKEHELQCDQNRFVKIEDGFRKEAVVDINAEGAERTTNLPVKETPSQKETEDMATIKKETSGVIKGKGLLGLVRKHINIYSHLSKWKLTLWVTASSCFGYFMLGDWSVLRFSSLVTGVFLCSCSANTFNQIYERELDKLMKRTRKRPLPNNQITLRHAKIYGFTTALVGTFILCYYNNFLTAALGLFNIILYTCAYTPLKTKTPYNTHIGSIVGSIPTLMGCTSVTPTLSLPEPWMLFITQLLWQFPHFYSLAYLYKEDYIKGNYKMFPLKDTNGFYTGKLCKPYMTTLTLLPFIFYFLGYTSYMYVVTSLLPNLFIYYKFHNFVKAPSRGNARSFFKHSLWHIILLLALSTYHTNIPHIKDKVTKEMDKDKKEETENCESMCDQDITNLKKKPMKFCIAFL